MHLAITKKFPDYLIGHEFQVITDSNPISKVLTSKRRGECLSTSFVVKSPHLPNKFTEIDTKLKAAIESLDVSNEEDALAPSSMFPTYDKEDCKGLQDPCI